MKTLRESPLWLMLLIKELIIAYMIGFEITDIEYSVCLPRTLKNHLSVFLTHWAGEAKKLPPPHPTHIHTPIPSLLEASLKT